jgi:hypothetical protein
MPLLGVMLLGGVLVRTGDGAQQLCDECWSCSGGGQLTDSVSIFRAHFGYPVLHTGAAAHSARHGAL